MKKVVSLVLALAMSVSAMGSLSVSAEVTSYQDTAVADIGDTTKDYFRYASEWGESNSPALSEIIDATLDASNRVKTYTRDKATDENFTNSVFAGTHLPYSNSDYSSGYARKLKGERTTLPAGTYVCILPLKNASADPNDIPYFGVSFGNNDAYSEYVPNGEDAVGVAVTSTTYKNYAMTITLPVATAGMNMGISSRSDPGSVAYLDTRNGQYLYLDVEQAYDLTVTPTGETAVAPGETVGFTAEVINQGNIPGTLTQDVRWLVTDTARTTVYDNFTVTDGTVAVPADATAGTYTVVAVSDTYGFVQGYEFEVTGSGSSGSPIFSFVDSPTVGVVQGEPGGEHLRFLSRMGNKNSAAYNSNKYTAPAQDDENYAKYKLLGNWAYVGQVSIDEDTNNTMTLEPGTYVFQVRAKNSSSDPALTPYFGITGGMATKGTAAAAGSTVEEFTSDNAACVAVTSTDFQFYTTTVTFENKVNFLTMGISNASDKGAVAETDGDGTNMYLAPEVAGSMTVTPKSADTVEQGGTIEFEAELLNQGGIQGTLSQDFDWYVVDAERTAEVQGFTAENGLVTVPADAAPGTYVVVARSAANDFVKGYEFTVTKGMPAMSATLFELEANTTGAKMSATVANATCSNVMFAIASYVDDKLINVSLQNVAVGSGAASVTNLTLKDGEGNAITTLANGTEVKAFIWTDGMSPVDEAKTHTVVGASKNS